MLAHTDRKIEDFISSVIPSTSACSATARTSTSPFRTLYPMFLLIYLLTNQFCIILTQSTEKTGEHDGNILTSLRVTTITRVTTVGVRAAAATCTQSSCRRRRSVAT